MNTTLYFRVVMDDKALLNFVTLLFGAIPLMLNQELSRVSGNFLSIFYNGKFASMAKHTNI